MPASLLTVTPLTASGISHVGFNPKSIGSLDAWYDAAQISGIASGASLSAWTDLSGSGFHLTQASAGSQPLYIDNDQNGNSAVRFIAGNKSFLVNSAYSVAQPRTVFIVSRSTNTAAQYNLVGGGTHSNTLFNLNTSGLLSAFAGALISFPNSGTPAWNAFGFVFNGSTSTGYLNGSSNSTAGNVGSDSNTSFIVGQTTSGNFSSADIGEIASFSRSLAVTEVSQLMTYFGSRWSIAIT